MFTTFDDFEKEIINTITTINNIFVFLKNDDTINHLYSYIHGFTSNVIFYYVSHTHKSLRERERERERDE